MIHKKIDRSTQHIVEAVIEARVSLADGWQPEDLPIILHALDVIAGETVILDDVVMDIDAACRCLTVGRDEVYDDRFKVRERALTRSLEAQSEAVVGCTPVASNWRTT